MRPFLSPQRNAAFTDRAILVSLAVGLLIRVWVVLFAVLPPERPLVSLLVGILQDVAILAPVAGLSLLLSRTAFAAAARSALAAVIVMLAVAQLAWAEAFLYFGHRRVARTS